jgi:FtsP/CotA-like multicopper oxidase with cupredoxin domain
VFGSVLWLGAKESNVGELGFGRELPVPPLVAPESHDGRSGFELEMREGEGELLAGTRTSTWGYNGPCLGPTLRATRGEYVQMRVTNDLPSPRPRRTGTGCTFPRAPTADRTR